MSGLTEEGEGTLVSVVVPPYGRTQSGRVFRIFRSSELIAPDRVRYVLRAVPIGVEPDGQDWTLEVTCEVEASLVRDKIANRQAIPTPEATFEDLWQRLRLDLDARYA